MSGNLDYGCLFEVMNLMEIEKEDKLIILRKIQRLESIAQSERDNKSNVKSHEEIKKDFKNKGNIKL